ncbi:hypothetical protein C8R46DRAFT_1067644 [Mycena filopes]|nr:hypothetical protein C8R46DRAFT_1067644 [Mycena filopes]
MLASLLLLLGTLTLGATAAPADVTLVAPFFNPISTALPATILGVDALGRTTYALNQDAMLGTETIAEITGILVEASDYVSYTIGASASDLRITVAFECALQRGAAVCTGLDESSHVATVTAEVETFVVDVLATTTAPLASTPSGPHASATPTSTPGSISPASTAAAAPQSSSSDTKPSASRKVRVPMLGGVVALVLGCYLG